MKGSDDVANENNEIISACHSYGKNLTFRNVIAIIIYLDKIFTDIFNKHQVDSIIWTCSHDILLILIKVFYKK